MQQPVRTPSELRRKASELGFRYSEFEDLSDHERMLLR